MIARALTKYPKILLLDEPFSNLDFNATADISRKMSCLHEKRELTTLAVIHDINAIPARCDRVVLMNRGRVVEDGSPKNVLNPNSLKLAYESKE